MFVRIKTRNNTDKKAVQIVKSIRFGSKVRQKVVQTVGYAFDDKTLSQLKHLAEQIKIRLEIEQNPTLFPPEDLINRSIDLLNSQQKSSNVNLNVNLSNIREDRSVITGIHQIYGYIYDLLGFDKAFTKSNSYYLSVIKDIVMARLALPTSKKEAVSMLNRDFSLDLDLSKVYRAMDRLDDFTINKIQKTALKSTQTILGKKIQIAFYDCTTLYFESFKSDELKIPGYSKDNKFNQPQVLLSLVITEEGLPLGYQVYPGNTYEGNTLVDSLEKLKKEYKLEEITVIADSGLMNKENIMQIEERGYKYIIGCRVKNLKKAKQKEILEGIKKSKEKQEKKDITKKYETKSEEGERIIVRWGKKRAEKDKKEREKYIEKLEEKIKRSNSPKTFMSNYQYKKYLEYEGGKDKIKINEEKIKREEEWDGISAIKTNIEKRKAEELIYYYKELWQIESCFRVQKHDLKIRPIYHWTPRRVKSHINICYQAFCCQQYIKYRMRIEKINMSSEEIRKALMQIKQIVIKDIKTEKRYAIPSKMNEGAEKIYKILQKKYNVVPYELPSK